MRNLAVFLLLLGPFSTDWAQTKSSPFRRFYFSWGYTRAAYSKSDIHLRNLSGQYNPNTQRVDYYDFTLIQAKAHDRPDFDGIPDVVNISIPQYVWRLGYYFKENFGVELNFDHTKYVVTDYQQVRIRGQINDHWFDETVTLDPNKFLHFEHSDGANFLMANLVLRQKLFKSKPLFEASWVFKPGAGIVIPRTDVTLFGQKLNNNFKVAGYLMGIESGFRLDFLKCLMFELVGKASHANYVNAFVMGKGHGKASHKFDALQVTASLGWKFGKRKSPALQN